MGSAAAWWLARSGHSVVLLEQYEAGHSRGSSHGPSRIFRFAYPEPAYVALARRALPLWRLLEAESGLSLLDVTGGVDHGTPDAVEATASALEAAGAAFEMMSAGEAETRWAGMRFDGPVCFSPDGGRVHADRTVEALHRSAAAAGAELRFNAAVTALEPAGAGVDVVTAVGTLRVGVAVVAAGGWASFLLRDITPLPRLTVTQEQVFHFPSNQPDAAWPSFIHHGLPIHYGLESPGVGVKVAEHHTGQVLTHPDRRRPDPDPAGRDRVLAYVRDWLPGLAPEPLDGATCLYTTTPSEDFVIDRIGRVVVAAGFSGHGFKFTPAIGQILAELATGPDGTRTPIDRFRLPA